MKFKHISLIISLLILFQGIGFAQDLTQYYLTRTPQSLSINPAFVPQSRIYVSLPVISNIQLSVSNGFSFHDVLKEGTGLQADSLVFNSEDGFIKALRKNNTLAADFQTTILGFGFRVQNMYFSFDLSTKASFRLTYPKDLVRFLLLKNGENIGDGNPMDFSKLRMTSTIYNQVGLGYAMEINDQLTVGGKLKYLQGVANADIRLSQKLYTASNGFDWSLRGTNQARISAPVNVNLDNDSTFDSAKTFNTINVIDELILNKNRGLGIDLGAEYKFDDKWTFSASLLDVGFIRWKTNISQINSSNSIPFNGIHTVLTDTYNSDAFDSEWKAIGDTLEKNAKLTKSTSAYTTYLSARFNLGATYSLSEKVRLGALTAFQFYNKTVLPSVTLSVNANPCKWFGASLSYSYANYSFRNLGLGAVLKLGAFQFYGVSDAFFNPLWLKDTRMLGFRMGMNLLFGNKTKVDKALIEEL